ncbi:MAG TPA: glycosyltransferase family 87 protein [Candidatus Eisenbacteria bacterium]|nr:glycosyltransferase family 87 protein [Candidatus Eisenbacteria bacterium]
MNPAFHQKRLLSKAALTFLALTTFVLAILPIVNYLRESTKDYDKWFWAGQAVLEDGDLYAPRGDGTFRFMYPPSAAVFFAFPSYFGKLELIVVLALLYSAAWLASMRLSLSLATGGGARDHPLICLIAGVCCFPYAVENALLGQPNLLLLALMLAAYAGLQAQRPWAAGALIALASAIKAFPILAVGYFIYRRHWTAAASTIVFLLLFLVALPSPFRGFARNLEDLGTWTRGMLHYDAEAISQREQRGFSWSNHSLVAVAHRLLRPVNAHRKRDETLFVNIANLNFKTVTAVILAIALGLCLFYIYCMPGAGERTKASDAREYAMLLLLILMFTPLAFTYFFVWLLYPTVVALTLVLAQPAKSKARMRHWVWFWACMTLLSFTVPLPVFRPLQASGSTLLAAVLLFLGIGRHLRNGKGEPRLADDC